MVAPPSQPVVEISGASRRNIDLNHQLSGFEAAPIFPTRELMWRKAVLQRQQREVENNIRNHLDVDVWRPQPIGEQVNSVMDLHTSNQYFLISLATSNDIYGVIRRQSRIVATDISMTEYTYSFQVLTAPRVRPIYFHEFSQSLYKFLKVIYLATYLKHRGTSNIINMLLTHPAADRAFKTDVWLFTLDNLSPSILQLLDFINGKTTSMMSTN
jgi:hypothetical protein